MNKTYYYITCKRFVSPGEAPAGPSGPIKLENGNRLKFASQGAAEAHLLLECQLVKKGDKFIFPETWPCEEGEYATPEYAIRRKKEIACPKSF